MENSITTGQKNTATFIHLSVFTQFIFPLGNFIAPLLIWAALKRDSIFVDNHGRRALNFQMSTLVYALGIVLISLPFIIYQIVNIVDTQGYFDLETQFDHFVLPNAAASGLIITALVFGLLLLALFVVSLFSVISAAVSASNGEDYKYPLTINFLKPRSVSNVDSASDSSTEVS